MTTTDFDLTHSSSLHSGKDSNGHAVLQQEKHLLQNPSPAYRRHAIALAVGWLPILASAQPLGGQVVSGSASIVQSGAPGQTVTTVKQNSSVTSIHWKSFNLGTGDTVNFVQPSSQAVAINRISDVAGSKIHGRIQANGQVWLLNPNGILFGKDAQINVGGLLASTLSTMDPTASSPALRQVQVLSGSSKAPVVNLGQINASEGGYVALLGHTVSNQGSMVANQGSVALGAGSDVSLQFEGSRLLSVKVNQHQLDALAGNGGLLQADGGRVILTAGARDSVLASAVNHTGVARARTVQMREGSIVLLAGMQSGQLNVAGTLDASAPDAGRGGFIETSGARVQIDASLQLSTRANDGLAGEWLIDPTDFTVGRGNVEQSSSGMSGAALSQLLANSNITIETSNSSLDQNGDIFINAALSWSSPYKLTLKARRDIYINDVITSSHSNGQLHLAFGQASADGVINGRQSKYWVNAPVNLKKGLNFFTQSGSASTVKSYYVITELGKQGSKTGTDLKGIDLGVNEQRDIIVQSKNYVLGADIDASDTKNWNNKQGFKSLFITDLLTDEISYQGTFDGLGHVISGLTINKPGVGVQSLFSVVGKNGVVQNLGMKNVNYLTNNTGGITFRNFGSIRNSFVDGGSLISGDNFRNLSNYMGGLVGNNLGVIEDSYANVTVGMPDNNNSYSTLRNFSYRVGGLVGLNSGSIINSYANGLVYASQRTVTGSDGTQTPAFYAGGLVGQSVTSNAATAKHSITGSVWNSQANTSPGNLPAGMKSAQTGIALVDKSDAATVSATALDSQQMMKSRNFSAWNKDQTWIMYEMNARPLLRAFMTPLYLKSKAEGSKTYDGSVNFTTGSVKDPGSLPKLFAGTLTLVLDDPNAGYRQAVASGYYSDQVGYQIVYDFDVNKVLVEKAHLTFTADKASFTIGQTIDGLSGTYKGLVGSETLSQVTSGKLNWRSNTQDTLKAGQFSIEANGLSSSNYELKQDPSNQTAMTVRPFETPALIPATAAFNQRPLSFLQPSPSTAGTSGNKQDKQNQEAVALASGKTLEGVLSGGIYEFCLPKPPSMLSVASATCVRGKQP